MKKEKVKVEINILKLAMKLRGRTVTVRELAKELGTSPNSAGRILALMEKMGLAQRLSRRAYRILPEEEEVRAWEEK